MNNLSQGVNGQVARLNNRIDTVQSRANGGIASAMAMAALPQAYLPNRSMLSVGGATWSGESGYAVGLSTVSDNGAWVLKLSGGASSRGDYWWRGWRRVSMVSRPIAAAAGHAAATA